MQPLFSLHPCKVLQTNHQLLLLLIEVGKPFCFPSRTIWSLTVLPELILYFFFLFSPLYAALEMYQEKKAV